MDTSTPILVLRRGVEPFHHGLLGIARSAGRLRIPVYVIGHDAGEAATRSRYVAGGRELEQSLDDEQMLEALVDYGQPLGRPMLVALDDAPAVFVDEHYDVLRERFLLPEQPAGLARRLASKRELYELCRAAGVPAPESTFPTDEATLLEQAEQHGYPVVVKRSDPWLPGRDPRAPRVFIAQDREQLLDAYGRMESPDRPQIMLQRYLPGGPETVWMFNGYFGPESRCLCAFTGRKLRQYKPHTGPTSLGVCLPNQAVADVSTRLMHAIGYRGIVDMGLRYDSADGSYRVLDVNPRIGNTFRLFVDGGGLDVLRAAYLDLTGQPVPDARLSDGRRWIVEPNDLASSVEMVRRRELRVSEWARSLRRIDEAAWWAADDPAPFLAMCARLAGYAYARGRRGVVG